MYRIETPFETVVDGLTLPECPRWQEGALYFADILQGQVFRMQPGQSSELIHQSADDFTGGIGFLPGGNPIVVHSKTRQLVRIGEPAGRRYADLTGLCRWVLNDMITANGFAYVSQPGFDIWSAPAQGFPPETELLLVAPDGTCSIAASSMMSPNGMAVSPDGLTIYVAECTAMCISAFSINPQSGALSSRRIFARLPDGAVPDGICLDSEGAVWAAAPVAVRATGVGEGPGVLRLAPDGSATHVVRVDAGRRVVACAFGGPDRSDLYVCTVGNFDDEHGFVPGQGRIERVPLPFRGAGSP